MSIEFIGVLDTLEETKEYVDELGDVIVKLRKELTDSFPEDQKKDLMQKLEAFQWKYRTLCEVRDRYYMWQDGYLYTEIEKETKEG
ncbi:hypothetical protein N9948_00090 [bacterium]|nr:hypothetical protein [bacterium]